MGRVCTRRTSSEASTRNVRAQGNVSLRSQPASTDGVVWEAKAAVRKPQRLPPFHRVLVVAERRRPCANVYPRTHLPTSTHECPVRMTSLFVAQREYLSGVCTIPVPSPIPLIRIES